MRLSLLGPILLTLIYASFAGALEPPMPDDLMEAESNTVIDGEVTRLECTADKGVSPPCVSWVGYRATIKVLHSYKGNPPPEIVMDFRDYRLKEGCTGHWEPTYKVGDKGKFYMRCVKGKLCHLAAWNGFTLKESAPKVQSNPECK